MKSDVDSIVRAVESGGYESSDSAYTAENYRQASKKLAAALKEMQAELGRWKWEAVDKAGMVEAFQRAEQLQKLTEAVRLLTEAQEELKRLQYLHKPIFDGKLGMPDEDIITHIDAFLKDARPLPTPEQVAQYIEANPYLRTAMEEAMKDACPQEKNDE